MTDESPVLRPDLIARTAEALARARAGEGPTLIEAVTYRLMMHTTADDPTRYREDTEVEAWWQRDPLVRFRKYLAAKGLWDDDRQALLEEPTAIRSRAPDPRRGPPSRAAAAGWRCGS